MLESVNSPKILTLVCTVLLLLATFCYSTLTGAAAAAIGSNSTVNSTRTTAQLSTSGPKPSNDSLALWNKGVALLNMGKYNESIAYFDKALAINPKNIYNLSWYKGVALLNMGKYKESIAYFDKALTIKPDSVDALTSKGHALLQMGKNNESIAYFDKALAINPKSIYALYFKADALLNMGKYKESVAYFDKALAIAPTSTFVLAGKKVALAGLNKTNIIANHTGRPAQQQQTLAAGTTANPSVFGFYFTNPHKQH